MGGINHQPCGSYLHTSTTIPRLMTAAYASFLKANVALEDVILEELDGRRGDLSPVLGELADSRSLLLQCKGSFGDLRLQIKALGFSDLPTLHEVDLDALGEDLGCVGAINRESWTLFANTMRRKGFRGSLALLEKSNEYLIGLTEQLRGEAEALVSEVQRGQLSVVLEENRPGNIKLAFAVLFNVWSTYTQEFLASSLISTELWYAHKGFGSIAPQSIQGRASA